MSDNDPNILYGGDLIESTEPLSDQYKSLGDLILSDLKLGEDRTSFINGSNDKIWTFRDMLANSVLMGKVLHGAGIQRNDVISIISENRHEFPAIAFGAFYLNAIVAPNSATYTERELIHALELSKPKIVFVSAFSARKTMITCRKLKFIQNVVIIGGASVDSFAISLDDFVKKFEKTPFNVEEFTSKKVDIADQVALIMCSSGTTGMPKGVMTTQQNMMSVINGYRELFVMTRMLFDQTLIVLNIAPWFHALGFISMFMVACSRETIYVFLPKFQEETFLRAIEKYKVNIITLVPPVMVFLAKSPLVSKYDLTSVKDIGCGAAALSKDIEDQVLKRFDGNVTIRQGYGMSETTLGTLGSSLILKPGSVGEPLKGVYVKVIDEDGKTLGPNKQGELCFKGDRIMKGYVNDPTATNETIDKDGWLHSGDIGYYDEDKQFFIVDRLKELIKYKAFQVPPAEIEALLLSNPKVKDCGVIGIPDEESGELPFAFVVKQPGIELTEKEVADFVAENASKPKWLRGGVKFIDLIPRNPSGKLLRREMRQMYQNMKSKL